MKEIKFRAWDTILNRMYPAFGMKEYMSLNEMGQDGIVPQTAIEIELMQFTGVLDKNGKEIFEGDILELYKERYIVNFGEFDADWHTGHNDGTIECIGFYMTNTFGSVECSIYNLISDHEQLEIIGNIHENPELMK